MKYYKLFVRCLLVIIFIFFAGTSAYAATYGDDWKIEQIASNAGYYSIPTLDNGQVAWRGDDTTGNSGIFYWDGVTTHHVTSALESYYPSLYDGKIAWRQYDGADFEIKYWNGSSIQQITNNAMFDMEPSLGNGEMAYEGIPVNRTEIYYWDGSTSQRLTNNDVQDLSPSLHDGKVAWESQVSGSYQILYWDGVTTQQISSGNGNVDPSLYDGKIAWQSGSNVSYWDGATTQAIGSGYYPSLYDGAITWTDGHQIYFWDGDTVQQITFSGRNDYSELYEGQIVWRGGDVQGSSLYLATNTEYYVTLAMDDWGIDYTSEEADILAQLYADGKAGLEPGAIALDNKEWTYLSGDLPGDIGGTTYNIGDSWIYDGKYYIKLGSGLEGGAVPEIPPFGVQGMVLAFGSVSIWVKKRRVKVSQNQSVRE